MKNPLPLNKKILVISSWAPPAVGGPQYLFYIFSAFQPGSYSFFTSQKNFVLSPEFKGSPLPAKYFFYDRAKRFQKLLEEKPVVRSTRWWGNGIWLIKQLILKLNLFFTSVCEGYKIVQKEKIDLLIGMSDEGRTILQTFLLSKLCRKPYAFYLFDLYQHYNLKPTRRFIAFCFEPMFFRCASVIMVTNEGTREYYSKLYGESLRIEVIHNSTRAELYKKYLTPYQPQPPYTIVFTGHIYWAQERSVRNLIRAVLLLKDFDIRFRLYVPNLPHPLAEEFKNDPRIQFTAAPQSEMPRIQSQADILVLPLAWHTPSPKIIATATPGKLTDYLTAGRPILVHAPPYAYVTRYARECRFAHVVDEENSEILETSIKKLLFDVHYAQVLIGNAQRTFEKNHDANVNAVRFAKIINNL